jgi:hypothetical protein
VLSGTGQITAGKSQDYILKIQSGKKGDYKIKTSLDIKIGNREFKEEMTHDFGVGVSGMVPVINISDLNPKTYDPISIVVSLYNRDKYNITTEPEIKSNLFTDVDVDRTSYDPGTTTKILDKTITAPKTTTSMTVYVEVSGEYRNERGIDISYSARKDFTVEPEEKVVKLTQTAEVTNDTARVKVSVENLKDTALSSVEVFDLMPKGFKVAGEQTKTVSLNQSEKKQVLDYLVLIPEDYSKDSFLIDHTVNIKDEEDEFFIQEISLRVDLTKKVQEGVSEEVIKNLTGATSEETVDENGTPTNFSDLEGATEKEPGFFGKIWRGVVGVIKNIFGKG